MNLNNILSLQYDLGLMKSIKIFILGKIMKLVNIIAVWASCLLFALLSGLIQASVLEEVVITAQKREQNLQDVGIAVTSLSGDQMQQLGFDNTIQITEQIPGLQVLSFTPAQVVFNIRGVSQNNFTDNNEAPVAVYVDDAYLASMNGLSGQLFDIERVEVLRGPQGTLFGRNATGGVIHYMTNGADSDETNGYIQGTLGDFSRKSLEFAVGGAFSENARYRFAGRTAEMDGYMKSRPFPEGNPLPPSGVDLGGEDGRAVRAEFQFDLSDDVLLTLEYKHTTDDKVPTGAYAFLPYGDASQAYIPPEFQDFVSNVILEGAPAEDAVGLSLEDFTSVVFFCESQLDCFAPVDGAGRTIWSGDHPSPMEHYSDYPGYMDRDTDSVSIKLDWDLAKGINLTSITNYFQLDKFYTEDGDGLPVPIIEFTTVADFKQFSQELRISGESDSFRWVAGAYFLDMELDADVLTRGAPIAGVAASLGFNPEELTQPGVAQDYLLESENWSVFGQGEWDISERLTFILGLRWSQDDKEMDYVSNFSDPDTGVYVPALFDLQRDANAAGSDVYEIDYGDWAGRVQLDMHLSDDTLLYASFNRGIKGGNWAPSASATLDSFRHDEEILESYEVGLKMDLAGGRARFNAAAFYYDYEGYQAFTFLDGTPSVTNADGDTQGLELELVMMPNEHWDISIGASFQESSIDRVKTPQQQTTPVGFQVVWPIKELNDVELPNAPEFAANYIVRYNTDMLGGNVALQLDGAFYAEQYVEISNAAGALQPEYSVHNARLSWMAGETGLRLTAWVRNLTDEHYAKYRLDLGILGATGNYAPPRTYGVTAAYHF